MYYVERKCLHVSLSKRLVSRMLVRLYGKKIHEFFFECVLEIYFLYFSSKTYVLGTQKNQNTITLIKFPYLDLAFSEWIIACTGAKPYSNLLIVCIVQCINLSS